MRLAATGVSVYRPRKTCTGRSACATTAFANLDLSAVQTSQREPNLKPRVAGFRTYLNISSVLLHNPLHRVESQARAFANAFRREKRFEDVRAHVGGNSRAVVGDLHHRATVVAVSPHAQLTGSVHRIYRVIDD